MAHNLVPIASGNIMEPVLHKLVLPEPILANCQLDNSEQIVAKFEL